MHILQFSILLGMGLTILLGVGVQFGSEIFTKDMNVQKLIHKTLPVCAKRKTKLCIRLQFLYKSFNYINKIQYVLYFLPHQIGKEQLQSSLWHSLLLAHKQSIPWPFVFDGINFGSSDYAYSAYSMASFFIHSSSSDVNSLFF